jgi:hypothetical protein
MQSRPRHLYRTAVRLGLLACMIASGCSWQRIPKPPQYQVVASIPLKVGIRLAPDTVSSVYGPMVARRLQEWHVFEHLEYPYREGDDINAVLELAITGGWNATNGANFVKGFVIGLSLFTLSPVLGPGMTGRFQLSSTLSHQGHEVALYTIHQETSATWGLMANEGEVGAKARDAAATRLAAEVSQRLQDDWPHIANQFPEAAKHP